MTTDSNSYTKPTQDQHVTVLVPVYNEEDVLRRFHEELATELSSINVRFDVLYVNDGSTDSSKRLIEQLQAQHDNIYLLDLSRNFGKEIALTAGLDHAVGDAVVIIDADLQDPPKVIKEFVDLWQQGFDIVYGRRISRDGETWFKKKTASWFYALMSRLSDTKIPRDAGDFRLLSRRTIEALNTLRESHRYMKGLYHWVGFPQKEVLYERAPRAAGVSKWNYWRLWNLALEGITSFSDLPLRVATYIGLLTAIGAFGYGLYMVFRTMLYGNPVAGYPSLMVVVLFLGGVQLICMGIIGEYLARTYAETKKRTLYFVNEYLPARSAAATDKDEQ